MLVKGSEKEKKNDKSMTETRTTDSRESSNRVTNRRHHTILSATLHLLLINSGDSFDDTLKLMSSSDLAFSAYMTSLFCTWTLRLLRTVFCHSLLYSVRNIRLCLDCMDYRWQIFCSEFRLEFFHGIWS